VIRSSTAVPVPAALLALSATSYGPATVGVPEMAPVAGLAASPAGSTPTLKLVGELLAVTV
jgi:hypothetical protein